MDYLRDESSATLVDEDSNDGKHEEQEQNSDPLSETGTKSKSVEVMESRG